MYLFYCVKFRTTDKEDMDARYQKLVASSLQGWKLLTSLLDADHQVKLHQQYTDILNNTKFWKLGKHQTTMVIRSKNSEAFESIGKTDTHYF